MKLSEVYEVAVQAGRDADPRGSKGVERVLAEAKKTFEDLPGGRRWEFDRESLSNPYSDTRILAGDPDTDVRRMLVGIDITVGEVLLADRLRERGEALDLVLAHHPEGRALADLSRVMGVQADIWRTFGVPIGFGDGMMAGRRAEVDRRFHASNIDQAVSAARILGIPCLLYTSDAADEEDSFLQAKCDEFDEDATVGDIVDMLKTIPEYREAVQS